MKLRMMNTALLDLPYYHPHFTDVNQVCDVLTPYVNQDGTYLLRDSKSKPGTLTISVMHQRQVNHFNIERREGLGYLLYEKYFKNVGELVEYYRTHDIPNREHINHIRLTNPIYSTRVTKDGRSPTFGSNDPSMLSASHNSGSTEGTVVRRSMPRQQSLTTNSTNGVGESHPPRRVQSERLESGGNRRGSTEPQLPLPPAAKESKTGKLKRMLKGKARSQSDSSGEGGLPGNDSSSDRNSDPILSPDPGDRPAPPIPNQNGSSSCTYRPPSISAAGYADPQDDIYTNPRDETLDMTDVFIAQLKSEEELRARVARDEKCHCGIRVCDSDLPLGWSVHRSQEPETQGRLFFVSADNTTSWTLPRYVVQELTEKQKKVLAQLRDDGIAPGIYRRSLISSS